MSNRCSTHCCCGSNCTCGDNCKCTETICCCEASLVVNSLGSSSSNAGLSPPSGAASPIIRNASTSQQVIVFRVSGMHCQSCVKTIKAALQNSQFSRDLENISVDLNKETVTVTTTTKQVQTEAMAEVMENVGFDASVLEINNISNNQEDSETQEQQQLQSPLFSAPKEVQETKSDELLSKQQRPNSSDAPETQQVDLVISGMTCSMCTNAIRSTLETKEGVGNVRVSLATDTATIEYQPSLVTIEDLVEEIQAIGYTVTEIVELQEQENLQRLEQSQEAQVFEKKQAFLTSLLGTIPILLLTMVLPHLSLPNLQSWLDTSVTLFGKLTVTREALLLWILATPVQFGSGWSFYRGAWYGLQTGNLGMDVLVAMGTTASYGYALEDTLFGSGEGAHFFETSVVLISFVLVGKWMNALAVRRTSHALTQLLQLQAKTATRVTPMEDNVDMKTFDPTTVAYREETVAIQHVHPGDMLKIKRGASIPADGILYKGEMTVDQSMITGESIPVLKSPGSIVLGGTVCVETSECFINVTGVGSSTALSQIVSLVKEAQTRQVPIQNLADKISSIFVPTVATLSVITFLVWYTLCNTGVVPKEWLRNENEATFSLMFGIACLVISCPCALGLATPTAVMVGTGVGAKNGILYKGGDSLEKAKSIDSIVFDKTGTVTQGKPVITDFVLVGSGKEEKESSCCSKSNGKEGGSQESPCCSTKTTNVNGKERDQGSSCCSKTTDKNETESGEEKACCSAKSSSPQRKDSLNNMPAKDILTDRNYILWLLGSLERNSEHPLAAAVVSYAESEMDPSYLQSNPFAQPSDFRALTGRGASGVIDGNVTVAVGNRPFCQMMNLPIPPQASEEMARLEEDGKTAILAAFNGVVAVVMGIADELKPDAAASIAYLQDKMGMEVWMVTGDNARTARAISQRLHLHPDRVISEALPVAKVRQVRKLQAQGRVVAMVGDGINDSPALAQADVGVSLGTGAEIAAEASDMVLVRANVADVCTALDLSRVIFRRIQLNFVWSLLYNCCGIPVAAGVFYPLIRTRLPPTLAALAMALSSLSVVSSSLALRLYKPPDVAAAAREGANTRPRNCCGRAWGLIRQRGSVMNPMVPGGTVAPVDDANNDMTRSLLANDHTAGPTIQDQAQAADDMAGSMEEGQA